MISEIKIDNSFPISQFTMTGYSIPFRLDRTCHGGGILLFVREDIPSKIFKTDCDADFEDIFVEINLRNKKWLLCCSYKPHKSNITNHLKNICKTLDKLNSTYDNLVLLGDFNAEPEEESISEFLNLYNLKNLVKQSTCFKNPNKPTCIDLILTNCPRSFQNTDTFETGLSDFHKRTFTVLKQHFPKQKPRAVIHRQYKNFRNDYFRIELENALLKYDINNIDYDSFIKILLTVLDKHVPVKKKYLRANHANFVTKQLRKAIMKRSKLRNDFLKDRNDASQSAYRKQRNLCVTLLRKAKKQYFSNLEPKLITENKKFWKSVKPLFSDKITVKEIVNLTENGEILSSDTDIADTFNDYFSSVVQNLNTPREKFINTDLCINSVLEIIEKYKHHQSIISINKKMREKGLPKFSFHLVTLDETFKEVALLSDKKASQASDIPVKIIKENRDLIAYFILHNFNNALSCSEYPASLKYADITPIFKKDDKTDQTNYRPISILSNLSKICERFMQNQMYPYLNQIFSKYQCGFRKGYNAQHCLMAMIEKWRKFLDIGGQAGALLTDLSKAFDCIDHELLIAKLHAYGFGNDALKFICSYLKGRKQGNKIISSYSSFAEILFGVPQGSILGSLLFNVYICDLFYDIDDLDFASFADDNTPYSCLSDMISVLGQLKGGIDKMSDWFKKNFLKGNADKCPLITSSKTPVGIEVANMTIMSEEKLKLLGIHIDNRLNFDYHIS